MFERRRRYGVTFLHVAAPAAIWTYVYAHHSAGEHMDLRLCMLERRRRYGATFLHMAAPAAIWTYVSAYASAVGDLLNVLFIEEHGGLLRV